MKINVIDTYKLYKMELPKICREKKSHKCSLEGIQVCICLEVHFIPRLLDFGNACLSRVDHGLLMAFTLLDKREALQMDF